MLVVSDGDAAPPETQTRWLMDPGYKRRVTSEAIATAWGLPWSEPAVWPAAVLDDVPEGTPLRPAPFLVTSDEGIVHAIDDEQCPLGDNGQPDPSCEPAGLDDTGADTTEGSEGGTLGTAGDGCQCQTGEGSRHIAWWSLLLVAGLRRRRAALH